MSNVHFGHGFLKIGDGEPREAMNFDGGTKVLDGYINSWLTSYDYCQGACGALPFFRRHSQLRYSKDRLTMSSRAFFENGISGLSTNYAGYWNAGYQGGVTEGEYNWLRARTWYKTSSPWIPNLPSNDDANARELAIGAIDFSWMSGQQFLAQPGVFPGRFYGRAVALSWIDIPGMTIGNHHRHGAAAPNGEYFFIDSGDIVTSQGRVTLGGRFAPPEYLLNHYMYQVYYTKSGGTGLIVGGVKTTGETFPAATNAHTFKDSTFGAFAPGDADGNHYIAIRSGTYIGTFKITAYIDANTVETDAEIINESFSSNETGLTWTMRTGPVAEYFWRRRPYNKYDRPTSNLFSIDYAALHLPSHSHEMYGKTASAVPLRTVYDGCCNYWCLSPIRDATNLDTYNLHRYTSMSPQGGDPTYKDGDITNMPVGIEYWSDLDCDDNSKQIWVAWRQADKSPNSPNQNKTLAWIDPAPLVGGNPDALNPECLQTWEAQSSVTDEFGLCSNRPIAVLAVPLVGMSRNYIWVFHTTGTRLGTTQDAGGITQIEPDGSAVYRLHQLHSIAGETLTFTNGLDSVTGGSSLDTKFAASGDFVRAVGDTRSYLVTAVTASGLTIYPVYEGVTGAKTIQKGVLAANQALIDYDFTTPTSQGDYPRRGACDYDKAGNIYWIPSGRDRVCKFVPDEGRVYDVLTADLPSDGEAFTATLSSVAVSRIPNFPGHPAHKLDNDIWVGSYNKCLARIPYKNFENLSDTGSIASVADLGGSPNRVRVTTSAPHGIVRVGAQVYITGSTDYNGFYEIKNINDASSFDIEHAWTVTRTGTWKIFGTRYHYGVTTSWPLTVALTGAANIHWNILAVMDRTSGQIYLIDASHSWYGGQHGYAVPMYEPNLSAGTLLYFFNSEMVIPGNYYTCVLQQMAGGFGRFGTSQMLVSNFGPGDAEYQADGGRLMHGPWTSYGWTGSAWKISQFNQHLTDLDFDASAGGPYVANPTLMAPGVGVKRALEIEQPIENGLTLKFTQLGSVAQTAEFVRDETTNIPCYVGWGKDNISDMQFQTMFYKSPTVYREGNSTVQPAVNMWTANGGVDGGYLASSNVALLPDFARGIAEPATGKNASGQGSYYQNFDTGTLQNFGTTPNLQMMAALRIEPEGEFTADGSVVTGDNEFTTAGAYIFTPADVGKTIVTEGSGSGNNGAKVITAYTSAVKVDVDGNFAATEGALRWKLVNIPAVGYVEFVSAYATQNQPWLVQQLANWKLYGSNDRGVTWNLIKQSLQSSGGTENQAISTVEDEGVYFSASSVSGAPGTSYPSNGPTRVVFDLTALPSTSRRRAYWKILRNSGAGWQLGIACVALYDDSHRLLGVPAANKVYDADDAMFCAVRVKTARMVLGADAYSVTATDDGDGDGYTVTLTLGTGSFYEQNSTDGDTSVGASQFEAVAADFTPEDAGKQLYIPAGVLSGAGTYTKFVTITSVVSAIRVNISVDLVNATGLTWALLPFGYNDEVYFDDDEFLSSEYMSARGLRPRILDVPASDTITLRTDSVPLVVPFTTGLNVQIMRAFPDGLGSYRPGAVYQEYGETTRDPTSAYAMYYDPRMGTTFLSDPLEFFTLHAAFGSNTTPADDDGDGRTNRINLSHDITTGFDEALVGDCVLVTGTGVGRRIFEITALNSDPSWVTVNLDELPCSLSGLSCTILRRQTWIKTRLLEELTVTEETI